MSVLVQEDHAATDEPPRIVNDFNINIATVNGSGSQTSNAVLIRALFNMGVPVTGKNLFPSNIQGLPTWYNVRLSKDGYLARRDGVEIMICMNSATVVGDMESVEPGGIILYDDALPVANHRKDVTYFPMPVTSLVKEVNPPSSLKGYVANFVYVGVLAWLLEIGMEEIEVGLDWNFGGKKKPIEMNLAMARAAYDWAAENLENNQPYRAARMSGFNEGKIMVDGNVAAALGAIFHGIQLMAWYPITPSSSIAETINMQGPKLRVDPDTGKATYAVIQAEDELAAIGMVVGAGFAGARAMTATSGPGISLMAEFIGLAYFAETPAVIWDVQRVGPSTGLPTRTGQGDILSTYYLSHGDTHHVLLFPSTPKECFDFAGTAFDLAERLQTPVFVMSDLDLGMNTAITDRFEYPDHPMDRGKVVTEEQITEWGSKWGRYVDLDGDGIPYRSIPGNKHPRAAYLARGTGHNEYAIYSEDPKVWEENIARLKRKFETARTIVPKPEIFGDDDASVGIISLGANHEAVMEARDRLDDAGISSAYLRLRALPIGQEVRDFIEAHEIIFVVEANSDGQLRLILQTEEPARATRLIQAAKGDGWPITARWITETILEHIG
jgi:2-oxoglutarate ferredoxin oxidoreductase subunit alpha